MSETKIDYVDRNGNFVNIDLSDISVTSDSYGSKLTSVTYRDCTTADCTKQRISATNSQINEIRKKMVVNMFEQIKDYKIYGKATVVYFTDGTKETVVCSDEDNFDIEQGITMCVIKRMFRDNYKKDVRKAMKVKKTKEENLRKREIANKEAKLREEIREKKARENKLKMKARYEARLAAAIEEEKKKLKK